MIFLASIEKVSPHLDSLLLIGFMLLKSVELNVNSVESFLPQVVYFSLLLVEFLLSNYLISYVEVFVESFSFSNVVGGDGVGSEYFSSVDVDMIISHSLLQPSNLNTLLVLHRRPLTSSSRRNLSPLRSCLDL